ncbi:MAG: hypothetical protein GDA50_07710 [Alphaproteobacteria bacterium GM202ARS2]|nr:hypothetical protein [Alphaproteobacteria bacterium GM202ARS2]
MLDLGSVEEPPHSPYTETEEYRWKKYLKFSQIIILIIFIFTIFASASLDFIYEFIFEKENETKFLNEIMTYTIPIFTFLLGMGAKSRDSQ